ncbi:hypothetical protein [Flavobacterium sp. U410]
MANDNPIVVKILSDTSSASLSFNENIKKYADSIFGNRIYKYLEKKEFDKFIKNNKNHKKYNYISTLVVGNSVDDPYLSFRLGVCGPSYYKIPVMSTAFYLVDKKTPYHLSEGDIKFMILNFKNEIDVNIEKIRTTKKGPFVKKSAKELNPNAEELKNLTLLVVDKDWNFGHYYGDYDLKKFITKLKEVYHYKIEIVDRDRVEQAILKNEKGVAFIFRDAKIYKAENFKELFADYSPPNFFRDLGVMKKYFDFLVESVE